jgi:hypothetical protein
MVNGVYGWRCPCGLSTVCARGSIQKSSAVACWDCKELHDTGGNFCPSCGKPLERLDAPGAFVEGGDAARATAYWRERLLEEELQTAWTERHHPRPPFPTDATFTPPVWTPRTAQVDAYEGWFRDMGVRWQRERDRAWADVALVAEVEARIVPIVAKRVAGVMDWERKHRCPRCGELSLTFMGVPNPM